MVDGVDSTGKSSIDAVRLDVEMDQVTVLDPTPTGVAIDPDPVQLPDGTWRVFVGVNDLTGPTPLQSVAGTAEDGNADASAPWTLGPTSGVHWSA